MVLILEFKWGELVRRSERNRAAERISTPPA
jgi:hypothetical protein